MDTAPAPFSSSSISPHSDVLAIEGLSLVRLIGHGPLASVYQARRSQDGAMVACKVLAPRRMAGARACERFLREVDVMRSLEHSRLVHMLETGVTNGHPYLMMPYFQGGNLEDLARARGGRLPVGEAVTLMTAALEGLAYMHERAFVHRDVKPGNLLVDGTGGAVVADFGIAKSFVDAGLSDVTSRTGTPFGTPAFMAREQVTNYRFVHPATDVWAASATLYYLITGEAPRDARAHRTAVDGILTGSILPVRAKRADVPNRVGTVIDKALAVEVEDRYPDAGAFLAALRRAAR